jgi:hypothetical protein
MIQFRITAVARRASSEVNTINYSYAADGSQTHTRTPGAEWEEVEFMTTEELKPVIQVANVSGDGFLLQAPVKLIVNNPLLFGMYKVGDIVNFIPTRLAEAEKTIADTIVVPQLS